MTHAERMQLIAITLTAADENVTQFDERTLLVLDADGNEVESIEFRERNCR